MPWPDHHRIRDSQRRSSPAARVSPAASWSRSSVRRASSARSVRPHRYASTDTPSSASGSSPATATRRLPVLERLAVPAGRGAPRAPRRARAGGSRPGRRRGARGAPAGPGSASPAASSAASTQQVELAAPQRREPVLDRAPREVVAERQRLAVQAQQPGVDALVDRGRVAHGLATSHSSAGPGIDGGQLDDRARRVADQRHPERDRVAHARRHAAAVRRGQRLGDEERVAARDGVQVGGIAAGPLRELGDGVGRQRRAARSAAAPRAAARRARAGPRAAARPRQVRITQPARARQAPAEQRDEVERRVVGPVQVLDHEHRAVGQRGQRRGQDALAGAGLDRGLELAAELAARRRAAGPSAAA